MLNGGGDKLCFIAISAELLHTLAQVVISVRTPKSAITSVRTSIAVIQFVTMETIERTIMKPGHVVPVLPHPNNYGQQSMLM